MVIKVAVTAEDIARGIADSCFACPIARALKRTMGNAAVVVTPLCITVHSWETGVVMHAEPSREARDFMYNVDTRQPVKPCDFDMEFSAMETQ